jgi:hypothetical protein
MKSVHANLQYESKPISLYTGGAAHVVIQICGPFVGCVRFLGCEDGIWHSAKTYPPGRKERHLAAWDTEVPGIFEVHEPHKYTVIECRLMELSFGCPHVRILAGDDAEEIARGLTHASR